MNSLATTSTASIHVESSATILIVDDRLENIHLLSEILSSAGYHVRKATSGSMAIRSATESAPDIVLLDVNMPVMDGYTVCRQLLSHPSLSQLPIIFISALDLVSNKVEGFDAGGVDYITKPFQPDEVLARVKLQLRLQRLQQQLRVQVGVLEERNRQLQAEMLQRCQAEQTYRSLFENASEGIFQISAAGQYIAVNPKLAEICGYGSPRAMLAEVREATQLYIDTADRLELLTYVQQYGKVMDVILQVRRADGTPIWVSENIRAVYNSQNQLTHYEGTVQDITRRVYAEQLIQQEQQRSERLIANLLPPPIAQRLKSSQAPFADIVNPVGILFADLVSFTEFSAAAPPQHTVAILNQIFSAFDRLVAQYGLEKIKTIGDAYMVAAGVPMPQPDSLEAIAKLALDMQDAISRFYQMDGRPFKLRIGLHTGSVVAGVIGKHRMTFDMWGHAVNLASRIEETCPAGHIQASSSFYQQLRHQFSFTARTPIHIQGIGRTQTYLLEGYCTGPAD